MNNKLIIIAFIFVIILGGLVIYQGATRKQTTLPEQETPYEKQPAVEKPQEEPKAGLSNPASDYCVKNGGDLRIITTSDGGQMGMCYLEENIACEEWAYMRSECDLEGDAALIRQALEAKGLDLSDSKVVIRNHLGKYIGGSVMPLTEGVGGGYVFAIKAEGEIKVLADGNGSISCSSFEDYPEFSNYLVPECLDEDTGTLVTR